MSARAISIDVLLCITVLCCWVGAIGMARMRQGIQALHYLAPPTTIGVACLTVAVFLQTGWGAPALKVTFISLILAATGSFSTHAAGRAFWLRDKTQSGTAAEAIGSQEL